MDTAKWGLALRQQRKMQGKYLRHIGQALYLDEMAVCRYELGRQPIPPDLLIRWALLLNAPEILADACDGCPIGAAMSQQSPLTAA